MICKKCGTENLDTNNHCVNCGEKLNDELVMIKCPNCNNEIDSSYNFCPMCGKQLVVNKKHEIIYCPRCGKDNDETARFCEVCGNEINKSNNQFPNLSSETKTEEKNVEGPVVCGIISICLVLCSLFVLFASNTAGIILGIIGLCKSKSCKDKSNVKTSCILGVIGITINALVLLVYILIIVFRLYGNGPNGEIV